MFAYKSQRDWEREQIHHHIKTKHPKDRSKLWFCWQMCWHENRQIWGMCELRNNIMACFWRNQQPMTFNMKSRGDRLFTTETVMQYIFRRLGGRPKIIFFLWFVHQLHVHIGHFPQDGENEQNVAFFCFLKLYCDQTVWVFSSFLNCSEEIMSATV